MNTGNVSNLRYAEKYEENPLVETKEIKTKQKTVRAISSGKW